MNHDKHKKKQVALNVGRKANPLNVAGPMPVIVQKNAKSEMCCGYTERADLDISRTIAWSRNTSMQKLKKDGKKTFKMSKKLKLPIDIAETVYYNANANNKRRIPMREVFDFLSVYDDDSLSDGAWQHHLEDGVRAYNANYGTDLDPFDTFVAYAGRRRGAGGVLLKDDNEKPFEISDIDDVRIIIKAKGKHWSIVPREIKKDEDKNFRLELGKCLLNLYSIVSKPLEDFLTKKSNQNEWQPIESAPKDGTEILVWHKDWAEEHESPTGVSIGFYSDKYEWVVSLFINDGAIDWDSMNWAKPTHWRPIIGPRKNKL